ncbi:alanine racemase [Streptomyces sp. NPDC002553]|uniref:alanine racemase n=1 Tax=Streptomyces sp. NPDC002553 TaxID=3154417 RepID=UPI0033249E74
MRLSRVDLTMEAWSNIPRRYLNVLVDLSAVEHNTRVVRQAVGGPTAAVMAVVKADAYGHGAIDVARAALRGGATWLGVCTTPEALELRRAGIDAPILAWLHNSAESMRWATAAGVDVSVQSARTLAFAVDAGRAVGRPTRVHLEVDTGLGRGGAAFDHLASLLNDAKSAQSQGLISVASVWSHLSHGEVRGHDTLDEQAEFLTSAWRQAKKAGLDVRRHLAGSLSALTRPDLHFDMVRTGSAIYGLLPYTERHSFDLRPAMRVTSHVALTKRVEAGQGVSYEHDWIAPKALNLALVPVGYADGVPRSSSGQMAVSIRGRRYPVVGRICMDQMIVNCGDEKVGEGEEVVLIGDEPDGDPTIHEWALAVNTTPCEIATNFSRSHVNRQVVSASSGLRDADDSHDL